MTPSNRWAGARTLAVRPLWIGGTPSHRRSTRLSPDLSRRRVQSAHMVNRAGAPANAERISGSFLRSAGDEMRVQSRGPARHAVGEIVGELEADRVPPALGTATVKGAQTLLMSAHSWFSARG